MERINTNTTNVGIISDTHGLLRPEAIRALGKPDLIVHAGDVGSPQVLESLRALAPVIAVRGNNDVGGWADALPVFAEAQAGQVSLCVIHNIKELKLPEHSDVQVVISGHSHRPSIEHKDGLLFLNPGSAGPRRFKLPVSVARIRIVGKQITARMIELRV
ncbi:MAG: YfcE family phosphodiesterase [Acidobacteria bacterium]|nr:MAG: YfcE family phosphodiesterase [Acidobacteriota bacterium]